MSKSSNANGPGSPLLTFALAAFRVVFVALLFAGIGMALGLFGGILFQMLRSVSGDADMALAYWRGAIPTAIAFSIGALVVAIVLEVRDAHRTSR